MDKVRTYISVIQSHLHASVAWWWSIPGLGVLLPFRLARPRRGAWCATRGAFRALPASLLSSLPGRNHRGVGGHHLACTTTPPDAAQGRSRGALRRCNSFLHLPPSTTCLPLFGLMGFCFWGVLAKKLELHELNGSKYHYLTPKDTARNITHAVRVQEASGSNPDTPTIK